MSRFFGLAILVGMLAACSPYAGRFAVPVDTTRTIYRAYQVDTGCRSLGPITIRIVKPPAHGRVAVLSSKIYPNFPKSDNHSVCNRTLVDGQLIQYTPEPGFAGTDEFLVDIIYASGHSRTGPFRISVR